MSNRFAELTNFYPSGSECLACRTVEHVRSAHRIIHLAARASIDSALSDYR